MRFDTGVVLKPVYAEDEASLLLLEDATKRFPERKRRRKKDRSASPGSPASPQKADALGLALVDASAGSGSALLPPLHIELRRRVQRAHGTAVLVPEYRRQRPLGSVSKVRVRAHHLGLWRVCKRRACLWQPAHALTAAAPLARYFCHILA